MVVRIGNIVYGWTGSEFVKGRVMSVLGFKVEIQYYIRGYLRHSLVPISDISEPRFWDESSNLWAQDPVNFMDFLKITEDQENVSRLLEIIRP